MGPRDVFTRKAVGFIEPELARSHKGRGCGRSGTRWIRDDIGLREELVLRDELSAHLVGALRRQVLTPGDDVSYRRQGQLSPTCEPRFAEANAAQRPRHAASGRSSFCHWPARVARSSSAMWRSEPMIRPQVSSAVGRRGARACRIAGMPRSARAPASIDALRAPVVTSSCRFGRPLDEAARERRTLAHRDERFERLETSDERVFLAEGGRGTPRPASRPGSLPQSALERGNALVVVQHSDASHRVSLGRRRDARIGPRHQFRFPVSTGV